jgi:hypothetical protein
MMDALRKPDESQERPTKAERFKAKRFVGRQRQRPWRSGGSFTGDS